MKSLASVDNYRTRTIHEAVEIERLPFKMNKRDDSIRLPHSWKPVTDKITVASVKHTTPTTIINRYITISQDPPALNTRLAIARANNKGGKGRVN